ncbi:hypothetical protein R75471_01191 [Paraburkholderia domus]|nr:hypothetical protein R75471_01191 [Paraburkholderia domus]
MNSSVHSAPTYLQMTAYAFWALTVVFAVVTFLVFQRRPDMQKYGIPTAAWIVIALAVFLQGAALLLGGRMVSLVFHIMSLVTVSAGFIAIGVYAGFIVVTGRSRKCGTSP